jgi:hypothetical protein
MIAFKSAGVLSPPTGKAGKGNENEKMRKTLE